mmetsp:Transcript_22557/g.51172  ORF Transcript_22557/g.51172 Transcript_22557/m.51172 type:complete len:259 (+) Transcript_22557:1205-1981(+)
MSGSRIRTLARSVARASSRTKRITRTRDLALPFGSIIQVCDPYKDSRGPHRRNRMLSSIPFVLFATTQEGFHSIRLSVSRHKPLISCFLCSTFQIHMIFDAIEECRALNILECCSDLVNNRLAFRRALGSTLAGAFRVNRYIRTAFLIVDDSNLKVTGYSGVHLLIDGNQTAEFLFQELSEGLAVWPVSSSSAILDPYKQDLGKMRALVRSGREDDRWGCPTAASAAAMSTCVSNLPGMTQLTTVATKECHSCFLQTS